MLLAIAATEKKLQRHQHHANEQKQTLKHWVKQHQWLLASTLIPIVFIGWKGIKKLNLIHLGKQLRGYYKKASFFSATVLLDWILLGFKQKILTSLVRAHPRALPTSRQKN